MKGKLILGGGNKIKLFKNLDFLEDIHNLLYIPIAKKDVIHLRACDNFKKIMSIYSIENISLYDSSITDLDNYDCIYIEGGFTFKLLKEIKDSGLNKKLLKYIENGGTLIGNSAGAIIFGFDINLVLFCSQKDINFLKLEDTKGFNLLYNYDLQPHFLENQNKFHQDYSLKNKRNILGIPEESGVLFTNNKFKVIGEKPISLFKGNKIIKILPDEYFNLN